MNISLGYEIGTGKRVTIPVNHTVVLGQTQLSGKTTTLEAMVTRSGLRAIGFITKPGEKSFRQQNSISPFFSESSSVDYWKYIVSIVENVMVVKLSWQERGWIMKLCQDYEHKVKEKDKSYKWKAPKTLRALLVNVNIALPYLRGTAEMICLQLREYLESVIREIGKTEFASRLDLKPGINVMDVTELSDELKGLVIRSVIEHVHKHGRKTVIIIPEAWKFIPEGRSTPVKLALEGLIREGAGVGNFVWMDSQDLRGVDKLLLRSVIVWLFGVQRQKNEVSSTLASIPDHPKPTATEIMQLGKGEFYICYGSTLVRTYVQPAGMEDAHAQAIARGEESPDSWRQISRALDEETNEGTDARRQENGQSSNDSSADSDLPEGLVADHSNRIQPGGGEEVSVGTDSTLPQSGDGIENEVGEVEAGDVPESEDELMWKEKFAELESEYKILIEAHDALAAQVRDLLARINESERAGETVLYTKSLSGGTGVTPEQGGNGAVPPSSAAPQNIEQIYKYVKERASRDPGILDLLTRRPELRVTIERETIEVEGKSLRGALAMLITKKFFDAPKNGNTAFNELKRLGRPTAKPNVYRELNKLAEMGFLTEEETGFRAVAGMKVNIIEEKAGKAAVGR